MLRNVIVAGCACALGSLWSGAAWAQRTEADVESRKVAELSHFVAPQDSETVSKIRQQLEMPTEMDFTETQLSDVVDYLKDYHHIEIQLDSKALENADIGPDTALTRRLKGIKLRSALRLLLGTLDLTYVVRDEVLLITTPEVARRLLVTKIYPVADLIVQREGGLQSDDFKTLMQAIRSTISPRSWHSTGGVGDIACLPEASALVVMQTDEGQQDVAELLAGLRDVRDKQQRQAATAGSRAIGGEKEVTKQ
jgi:hypothetical protein